MNIYRESADASLSYRETTKADLIVSSASISASGTLVSAAFKGIVPASRIIPSENSDTVANPLDSAAGPAMPIGDSSEMDVTWEPFSR